ncbi:hypothetical protein PC129_g13212 [Phytophthora cactorum]|uniref:Uncharacterized protein n=1 Tax=Phytophthora cactorum TaxID=29920 RepID=A0A8T1CH42_9STRA|nr:hypothetical protein Pcac1_g9658 [Phytophthora cactorum]KAG2893289.1 hypothetical protein PC114_g16303 [Phytophthora cactorum]KAG2922801.1 hypothetical protein PC117_g15894 [Phytophthora cactorum]KAG3175889.1 hypothetical protein PC128_g17534 [Phytophthora cactorum]KAG3215914.1 hypothetical protein PC129_g13212 [Phytophthora cactorum]
MSEEDKKFACTQRSASDPVHNLVLGLLGSLGGDRLLAQLQLFLGLQANNATAPLATRHKVLVEFELILIQHINFRSPGCTLSTEVYVDNAIPPFRPYEIRSQLVFADAEWMYILHKFECPTTGRLYAEGLCRASCKQDDEKVSAAKLYDELPKDMPDVVVQLLKWDSSQRIKLEAPTEAARRQDETTTR